MITKTENIVNGYFYAFTYKARSTEQDVDPFPLIYCIRPGEKDLNNFIGLNLHHLPVKLREELIKGMQKTKNFLNEPRTIFSETELNTLVPGCRAAVREYSRKRVFNPYRIDSKDTPYYIYGNMLHKSDSLSRSLTDFILKVTKKV